MAGQRGTALLAPANQLRIHTDVALQKQVAERLRECLRDTDTVARLGGDEFIIMIPDAATAQVVGEVAQRVLGEFSRPFSDGEQEMYVSASIGISLFPRDGSDPDELVKHADRAMYSAKDSGRNAVMRASDAKPGEGLAATVA